MFTVRDLRFAWLLVAGAACWGFATAVSKSALTTFDPLALLARREGIPRTGQTSRLALLGLLPGLA